jgi:SNF2 family DNA or RNA helicase
LWEPGTGKSKFVVDWTAALSLKEGPQRVLIICPLSVIGVWEDEYEAHCPVPYRIRSLTPKDNEVDWGDGSSSLDVLVANYDLAWRRRNILDYFLPTVVVADESHKIKKPSTKRSRFLRSFSTVPHRAILSGTPTPKGLIDLYGQWVFLNPKRFGTNFAAFKRQYVIYGGYMNHEIRGYTNVDEFKKKFRSDATVVRKDEALDLPSKTYQRVPVVLEPEARAAYEKMAYELFLELTNSEIVDAKNAAVKILRLQQITGGWINSEEGNVHQISSAKLNAARERLEDLWDADERVVVFARFRPEVRALADLGVRAGVDTYVLSGDTRRDERDSYRRQFQAKAGPSLFVAQIQTGGLGITLHAAAEVLFYSVTYALDDYIQACDRVHRIGQSRPVRYQHLVARNTIDLDIYAALRQKQSIMDLVMGSPKSLAKSIARSLDIDTVIP